VYRIRLHGRGGQGTKTASRILGSALFGEGFEVQDAPRYGAERRGAPMFATVRADRRPIRERGAVGRPDLVVVADDTLVGAVPAVLSGLAERGVLLLRSASSAATWEGRLGLPGRVVILPDPAPDAELHFLGATCAGGAARLLGVVSRQALEQAIHRELSGMPETALAESLERAGAAFDALAGRAGCVGEGPEPTPAQAPPPDWIELPFEDARTSAPDIRGAATSVQVRTGLWRTLRPVVDLEHCRRCHWVCSTLCPDGVIDVADDGTPRIDYEHCKGCMVCVAVCPPHAIRAVPEVQAREQEAAAAQPGAQP
jgi:pyruvate ferredoxin oxidoreductase gamma subunit